MELLEYVKQLPGKSATVFLDNNVIRISSKDLELTFTATMGNYLIKQNTNYLGGRPVYRNGIVEIINQRPCQFQSGNLYRIKDIDFCTDMLGETSIKFDEMFCWLFIELESEDQRFCDISMESDIITLTEEKRSADRGKANVRKLKKLSSEQVKEIVQTQFKGHEISKEKFSELLFGDDRQWSVSAMTEGFVRRENARFFLINDWEVINTNCCCLSSGMGNADSYEPYMVFPYVLLAISANDTAYIDEYFIMSSFGEHISDAFFE